MEKIIYEIVTNLFGEKFIKATTENGFTLSIPMDEANSDYQAYLNKDNPTSGTIS